MVEPLKPAYVAEIGTDLESMQKAVGGDIETVYPYTDPLVLVCDEEGKYDKTLFTKYRLDKLKEAKDTVKYTLDMTLTKVDDEWQLDDLSDIDEKKIHGMYEY